MAWKEPKTDWAINPKNPMAEDFNRIEGNIQALKDDIEIKKGDIVNALQSIGMDVSITDTYEDIANKIRAADQGAKVITPGTSNITIPKGFHNGSGYVKGDSNLRSSNILTGKSIFGVAGSAPRIVYGSTPTIEGDGTYFYGIEVSGLGFTPSKVLAWVYSPGYYSDYGQFVETGFIGFRIWAKSRDGNNGSVSVGSTSIDIRSNGFLARFAEEIGAGVTAYWVAIE